MDNYFSPQNNWLKVIYSNCCHFMGAQRLECFNSTAWNWYYSIVILYILDMNSWFTFYSIYSQCIGLPTAVSPPLANETGKQPDHLYPTNNVFLSWKYNKWICSWTNNVFLYCWKCNKWICTRPTTYFSHTNTKYNQWICAWTKHVFLSCLKNNKWICTRPTTKDVSHEENLAHIYNKWA